MLPPGYGHFSGGNIIDKHGTSLSDYQYNWEV